MKIAVLAKQVPATDEVKMDPETGATVRSATMPEHHRPWKHEIYFIQGKYDKKHSNIKFNVLCCKFKNEEKNF